MAATLALGMCLGAQLAMPQQALAAEDDQAVERDAQPDSTYTYSVRLFPGTQGEVVAEGGGDYVVYLVESGKTLPIVPQDLMNGSIIKVSDDSKYYLKGWKFAGQDTDVTQFVPTSKITSDLNLVPDYGIKGEGVTYTVRYVDADGNELLPSETFYGNVGDSPILAYRYVEGFLPQAYNLTGELYSNPSDNVYTFTYNRLATPQDVTVITPTVVNPATPAAAAGEDAAAEATPAVEPVVVPEELAAEELIADDGTPLAEPAEIEDIRDDETPMASYNSLAKSDAPTEGAQMLVAPSTIAAVLGIAAIVLCAVAIALIVIYRRKNHKMVADAARASIEANFVTQPQPSVISSGGGAVAGVEKSFAEGDYMNTPQPQPFYNGQQYTGQPAQFDSQYTMQPNQYVQPPNDAGQYGGRG